MRVKRMFAVFAVFLMALCVTETKAGSQEGMEARPGDLIIRHQGKTFGPVGGIPHIGIYTGVKTTKNEPSYDVIDLGIENGDGVIRQSLSTDRTRFQNPGFYAVLESRISVRYKGRATTLSALPNDTKSRIRKEVCKMAENDLGSIYGKYQLSQFPKGHSVNCGDWVLGLYDKAFKGSGVQVMSHKFPKSNLLPGQAGFKHGKLRDYSELLWGTTDPSRLPGWLPQVGPPQSRGGVYIAPNPIMEGKGGGEIKERVLKSRPSGDSLSWPVELRK